MGKIIVEICKKDGMEISGLKIITPEIHEDSRGYFMEIYNERDYQNAGITQKFVQDNQSKSVKNVLRGLHYQIEYPQDKLVRVASGEVYDVAVDIRKGSPTFGMWYGTVLSAENKKQFFIPRNFAHGFLVLSETAEFAYKLSEFYTPGDEGGIIWNDPYLNIGWPIDSAPLVSEKDSKWKSFREAWLK